MDLNRVQMFAQVVQQGSFTKAAHVLGLTKATVSRKIAELEADAGVQLLYRTTRALKLTEAGANYYHRVKRILLDLQNAQDQLSASQHNVSGHLKIICPIELGQLYFAPVFARFLNEYPQITIDAELTNRKIDVIGEGVDMLIQISEKKDESLQCYALLNTPKLLMASPAYLALHGTPTTPEELNQHQAIRHSAPSTDANWTLFDGKRWVTIAPKSQLTTNNITLLREAAIEGLGIAALSEVIADDAISDGRLVTVLSDFPMKQHLLTLSMPQREYIPRKYRVFTEFLYQSLFEDLQGKVLEYPDYITRPEKSDNK
ncbi:LysR family transcriptional regulator [Shewanella intestini]|uniref:LysR family transcriptional regulator n=1 Tax=Shewanella intestini TaxID=2017544 RepID=A0ABS5I3J9_9GAMM|nr:MULTISPECIES: LysR family transcriptional regulator [Shewanella]MBR9728481.1 LysR family transcriptional regulator [Shewanella intestini]MRG36300.1 LysR family transcriptional regulator [Shewanella sp. XMDDZSB0408]